MAENVIEIKHATKRFGNFVALNDVSFEIAPREVVAIVGENGAGKSTLCKIITGTYSLDEGEMSVFGKQVSFKGPNDSMKNGIGMVYQERNLIGMLTGAQNICLGAEATNGLFLNERECYKRALEIEEKLGLSVPLNVPVDTLGAGEKQLIEIMRAFFINPKIIILDEPTASLGEGEIGPFLKFITDIKEKMEISIIFISHKIEEVFSISDKIVVLSDGVNTMTAPTAEMTQEQCIAAMLRSGKNIDPIQVPEKDFEQAQVLLRSKSAVYDGAAHDVDFTVRQGEVVGMYGLVGSGRTEYAEMLFGLRRAESKDITYMDQPLGKFNSLQMIQRGMILTPETRADGMFSQLSLLDNICNLFLRTRLSSKLLGFISFVKSRKFANEVLEKNAVRYSAMSQNIGSLSGGNIQKIIIGRSIEIDGAKLLIVDEPTTGMDIGAKYDIYRKIRQLADSDARQAIGIIFISSELEELMNVCDSICIFSQGNLVQAFARKDFDKSRILEAAIRGRKV